MVLSEELHLSERGASLASRDDKTLPLRYLKTRHEIIRLAVMLDIWTCRVSVPLRMLV